MGTHPQFSSTGPSATYQPKTTDESDSSVAGGVVPHVNVQQAAGATPLTTALPAGAATAANQTAGNTSLGALAGAVSAASAALNTQSFIPIAATAVALTVGPTATTTPVALPATSGATVYRIRNGATSTSPVAWRLQTTTPGTAPVIPTAYSTSGTGGTVGDKQIDPGGVEVFGLTAAQQTALAAGTLYLSAVTPSGGSATITLSLGTSGN